MRHLQGKLYFLDETRDHSLIGGNFRTDRFKRNPSSEFNVLGFVNFAHAASSDEANDSKAARDKLTGSEGMKIKQLCAPIAFIPALEKIAHPIVLLKEADHFGKNRPVAATSAREER
jgi:hypothetical protein